MDGGMIRHAIVIVTVPKIKDMVLDVKTRMYFKVVKNKEQAEKLKDNFDKQITPPSKCFVFEVEVEE